MNGRKRRMKHAYGTAAVAMAAMLAFAAPGVSAAA